MQTILPFKKMALTAPNLLEIFQSNFRNGVLRNSEVTAGGSGWLATIKAGEVMIDGSFIEDDADKIDDIDLGHSPGSDKHYVVYQTYAYLDTDTPAASVFASTAGITPPTQPTIPAGAVKLADIFVPAAATSIGTVPGINQQDPVQVTSQGVRIVQAPRLWPRHDTGELIDKLVMAQGNTLLYTQGAISYDDALGKLVFSQPVVVQSMCTTYRQSFNLPSLVRATIPAAPSGLSVPGTPASRDVLVYTVCDRSSPGDIAATVKFLDLTAPSSAELGELLNQTLKTTIIVLGVIVGAKLFLSGVNGVLPLADADTRKFLNNAPSGEHQWRLVEAALCKGTGRSVADITARDAIAADLREEGMLVFVVSEKRCYALQGGILNAHWERLFIDDLDVVGGLTVVADSAARFAISLTRQKQHMLVMDADTKNVYRLDSTAAAPTTSTNWRLLFRASGSETEAVFEVDELRVLGGTNDQDALRAREIRRNFFASRSGPLKKSEVLYGMEVLPAFAGSVPVVNFKAGGSILMPNDIAINHSFGDKNLSLSLSASYIEAVVPSFPSNVYIYYRLKAGELIGGEIRASATAPDSRGRPGAADATYTTDDYAYIGLLRPKASAGVSHEDVWGSFSVSHDGMGGRTILFDIDETALVGNTGTVTFVDDVVQTLSTGPATAPSTLMPTAFEIFIQHNVVLVAGAATEIQTLTAKFNGGTIIIRNHDQELQVDESMSVVSPNLSVRPKIKTVVAISGGSSTDVSVLQSARYTGVRENVNRTTHNLQTAYGL